MALPMVPYAEAGPLYGLVLPILISVAVTPTTVWAITPPGVPRATPRTRSRARNRLDRCMVSSNSDWWWCIAPEGARSRVSPGLVPSNRRPSQTDPCEPQKAGDAAGHDVHEHDQECAEDGP